MSTVNADAIKPRDTGLDITLGAAGDTTVISADSINTNTIKDSGGNTLWTSDGSGNLSSVNSSLKGNLVLLDTNTFTGATTSEFTTLIDSTYDVYKFTFNAINPATNDIFFQFKTSTDGGSSYGLTKTSTGFYAYHSGTYTALGYNADLVNTNDTNFQRFGHSQGNDTDQCGAGELYFFTPSSTTFGKTYYSRFTNYGSYDYAYDTFIAGYLPTTSAVNAVQFSMSSGNFDGEIKMYGIL